MPPTTPLMEVPRGEELRALLSPISPEVFVHEYFARKPLFVKGFPTKYKGLFNREGFIQALAQPGPASPDFLHASFDKGERAEASRGRAGASTTTFAVTPEQAVPLYAAGATLCATQIESRMPHLAPLVSAIKRQLGYTGRVTFSAYLSPPGAGFNWHWDGRVASTLQIEGTKRWRFSKESPVAWPRGNGVLLADGTPHYVDGRPSAPWEELPRFDEKDTTEVLLEPGDLLVLPAGAWHDARGGDGGSLALNLSFTPLSYTVLVRELLDNLLSSDPGWRGPAPLLPLPTGAPGEVDPRGLEAIATQLARAAEALRTVAADGAAMAGIWSSFVQATGYGTKSLRVPDAAPVTLGDRLRVRADRNVYARLAEGGDRLCVFIGTSGRVDATGRDLQLVQRILRIGSFVAGELAPEPAAEVLDTLTHLVREGMLERA